MCVGLLHRTAHADAVIDDPGRGPRGPGTGAAWVAQATATAIDVLANDRDLDEVLQEAKEHWTLRP